MNDLDFLLHGPERPRDSFRWATVTGTNPLRIRFDGDTTPLQVTPTALVPVAVGNRVWVQHHARSVIILGRAQPSGAVAIAAGTATIPVGGGSWTQVDFPAGRFSRPPVVTATVADSAGAAQGVIIRIGNQTTATRFSMHLADAVGTVAESAIINWIAVQTN